MAEETPRPDASTRWIETTRGVLRSTELAPLLAERVLRVQQSIGAEAYADRALDEELIRALHGDFCGDLAPGWAGLSALVHFISVFLGRCPRLGWVAPLALGTRNGSALPFTTLPFTTLA